MSNKWKKIIQYAGGGVIIAGAFAIMLPDVVYYLAGLWRIFSLIAIMVGVAFALVFTFHKLKPKQAYTDNETDDEAGDRQKEPDQAPEEQENDQTQ